jgi:hypothetical protein
LARNSFEASFLTVGEQCFTVAGERPDLPLTLRKCWACCGLSFLEIDQLRRQVLSNVSPTAAEIEKMEILGQILTAASRQER